MHAMLRIYVLVIAVVVTTFALSRRELVVIVAEQRPAPARTEAPHVEWLCFQAWDTSSTSGALWEHFSDGATLGWGTSLNGLSWEPPACDAAERAYLAAHR